MMLGPESHFCILLHLSHSLASHHHDMRYFVLIHSFPFCWIEKFTHSLSILQWMTVLCSLSRTGVYLHNDDKTKMKFVDISFVFTHQILSLVIRMMRLHFVWSFVRSLLIPILSEYFLVYCKNPVCWIYTYIFNGEYNTRWPYRGSIEYARQDETK